MVTGKLARNRRKRKGNYSIENKIKILSIDDLTFEDVHNKFNAGCLIVLSNLGEDKEIVYETSQDEKSISIASKESSNSIKISKIGFNLFNALSGSNSYTLIPIGDLSEGDYRYNELNRKLQIVNQK